MSYVYLFLIPMHDKVVLVLHACHDWVRTYLKSNLHTYIFSFVLSSYEILNSKHIISSKQSIFMISPHCSFLLLHQCMLVFAIVHMHCTACMHIDNCRLSGFYGTILHLFLLKSKCTVGISFFVCCMTFFTCQSLIYLE